MKLEREAEAYLEKRSAAGMAAGTAKHYQSSFIHFAVFLKGKGIKDLRDVDAVNAWEYVDYLRSIRHYRTNKILSVSSQVTLLGSVRQFYKHLYLEEKILTNPFEDVRMGRKKDKIPRDILSEQEMSKLFTALKDRYGLFGLAVGEILYGTGIRASELRNLKVRDVNFKSRTLFVRNGKGEEGQGRSYPRRNLQSPCEVQETLQAEALVF